MAKTSTARTKARTKKAAAGKTARRKPAISRTKKAAAKRPAARRSIARPRSARMLSQSTMRAKWIENVDDHEDRQGQSLATRNHEVILKWAEERGAQPATVSGTRHDDRPGVLRFDFPEYGGGKRLEHISWEEWFKSFDERELVFVYQEHLKKGDQSNFFRLDSPTRETA